MVSQIKDIWYCKRDDTKPTNLAQNGQELREIDTGKTYHFDAETGEFIEWTQSAGE